LTPISFEKDKKKLLVYTERQQSDEDKMDTIIEDLKKSGVNISKYSNKKQF
jgi:ACT domain-containing protein